MPTLDMTLDTLSQRTGSSSGALETVQERIQFQDSIRIDLAAMIGQMNVVYYPLFNSLSKITGLDALDYGLSGNVIFSHINATAADASIYYSTSLVRALTIKESMDVLLTEIARLENEINNNLTVLAYDDTAVAAVGSLNTANLTQLRLDSMGSNYTFDADAQADLTYPLSQHIDAIGALMSGFPGTGNTYPGVYPALSLLFLASAITFDTTIAPSNITGLTTVLSNIATFTGMDGPADTTPTYSSTNVVVDGTSLETAIGALDTAVFAVSGSSVFATAANVTSNSPGTLATDSFVFGSDQLDDDANPSHDNRFLFDKTSGAFRAGRATGTEWDTRGSGSFATGSNNNSVGVNSTTFGDGNLNNGTASSILSGGYLGANTISGVVVNSAITHGFGVTIDKSLASTVGGINHLLGDGVTADTGCGILSGSGAIIDGGAVYSVVCGGGNGAAGTGGLIRNASSQSFIGGGAGNSIGPVSPATYAIILGGLNNVVDATFGAVLSGEQNDIKILAAHSVIAGGGGAGFGNVIHSDFGFIGSGQGNVVGQTGFATFGHASVLGGDNNKALGSASVVAGGTFNTAGVAALPGIGQNFIGAGNGNTNTSGNAFIGAGANNDISRATGSSDNSGIACGQDNLIDDTVGGFIGAGYNNAMTTSDLAVICGGGHLSVAASGNTITGSNGAGILSGQNNDILTGSEASMIGAGIGNQLTGTHAFIASGLDNTVSANFAVVLGGSTNTSSAVYTVSSGQEAVAAHHGSQAHAAGKFATDGDAQVETVIWRNQTTDATLTELYLDGASLQFLLDDTCTYAVDILVVGRQTGGIAGTAGDTWFEEIKSAVEMTGGVPTGIAGGAQSTISSSAGASWVVAGGIDNVTDALVINVTGEANKNINWVATARIIKVAG
jgi:hypothetical protein